MECDVQLATFVPNLTMDNKHKIFAICQEQW
jgi:hypothetical protein